MDEKKEQILDAALFCFARYGVYKATMDDIAAALGMKKTSLYYYYKNKEAIYTDALEREFLRLTEFLQQRFTGVTSAREKIHIMIREIGIYMRKKAEMLELNVQTMIDSHSMYLNLHQKLRDQRTAFIAGIILSGIEQGEFQPCDEVKVADAIRSIIDMKHLEMMRSAPTTRVVDFDFDQNRMDTQYILDLILDGLKS